MTRHLLLVVGMVALVVAAWMLTPVAGVAGVGVACLAGWYLLAPTTPESRDL